MKERTGAGTTQAVSSESKQMDRLRWSEAAFPHGGLVAGLQLKVRRGGLAGELPSQQNTDNMEQTFSFGGFVSLKWPCASDLKRGHDHKSPC